MNPLSDPAVQSTLQGAFRLILPEIALLATACVAFLFGCGCNRRGLWFAVSLAGIAAAAVLALPSVLARTGGAEFPAAPTVAPFLPDALADFVRWLALAAAVAFVFLSWSEVGTTHAAEYYGCLLVAAAGTSIAGRANDLITLFLGLEMLSIPTYVLLYLPAQTRPAQEAAVKYFLLSILSSAVLLFGFSYLYGATGSTNLTAIAQTLVAGNRGTLSPLALMAAVLAVAGIGFRITAVPFHFYAPDVYEGGPTGAVAQLAFLPKVAGFVALVRVFGLSAAGRDGAPFDVGSQVPLLLWIVAAVTMTLGNVLALLQDNLKRMLAYSGVAHGGYMLIGVAVAGAAAPGGRSALASVGATVGGIDALLVYLVAYGAMTVGAFAAILYLSTPERPVESIDDVAGLGQSHPLAAATLAVLLFSLIGLPLTAGFAGKFLLFLGAIEMPTDTPMRHLFQWLAAIAAVNAAVGAYYYLRVVGVMYLRSPIRPPSDSRSAPALAAAVACAAVTVAFGVYPEPLVKLAREAAPLAARPATAEAGPAGPAR